MPSTFTRWTCSTQNNDDDNNNNDKCYQVKDSYRKFVRQGRCLGHSSPVVQLDWSKDCSFLQSNSQDNEVSDDSHDDDGYSDHDFYYQVMVWSVGTGRPVRDIDAIRDIE